MSKTDCPTLKPANPAYRVSPTRVLPSGIVEMDGGKWAELMIAAKWLAENGKGRK